MLSQNKTLLKKAMYLRSKRRNMFYSAHLFN